MNEVEKPNITPKLGRPKAPPTAKKMLKELLPLNNLFNDNELMLYNSLVDIFLKDFDEDDLTAGDLDDIMTLSMNKIFELRLLQECKDNPSKHLDINRMLETSRKQTEKLKESLSSRRRDRVDPNESKGLSILDLAAAFDNNKKSSMLSKAVELKKEDASTRTLLEDYPGNKNDID